MIDLKAKPFCLSDADCAWVQKTIAEMSDEEKVGQLFFTITFSYEDGYLKDLMERYHLGGCRYNNAPGAVIRRHGRQRRAETDAEPAPDGDGRL